MSIQTKDTMIKTKDLGEFIFEERMRQKKSQLTLEIASGVNRSSINRYENDGIMPRFDVAQRLLDALGYELVIRKKRDE